MGLAGCFRRELRRQRNNRLWKFNVYKFLVVHDADIDGNNVRGDIAASSRADEPGRAMDRIVEREQRQLQ